MPDSRNDTALLLAAGQGDRQAFGALVDLHHRAVIHFIHRFLGIADRATAEDIAQDVFLAAWKAAPTFQPKAMVITWLLRITTNRCLNHQRSRRRKPTVPLVPELAAGKASGSAGPESNALQDDLSAALQAGLAELAPKQRAAVLLRYTQDLNNAEIAAALHTSIPVVKSLLFRAHRRLGELIDPEKI